MILGADNSIEALAKADNHLKIRSKSAKELQEAEAVEEEKSTTSEYMDQDGTFRRTKDAYYLKYQYFQKP